MSVYLAPHRNITARTIKSAELEEQLSLGMQQNPATVTSQFQAYEQGQCMIYIL